MALFPKELKQAAEEVAALLRERGETISVGETAAGGLISASLLSTPGASKFYKGGLTLYTLPSRIEFAGWTQQNIDNYKGPTPQVVSGLAENVRQKLGSTYCVSEVSNVSVWVWALLISIERDCCKYNALNAVKEMDYQADVGCEELSVHKFQLQCF